MGADAKIPIQHDGHGWPRRWAQFLQHPACVRMSKGQWRFKPSEIERAVKSVQAAGLPVRNIEIAPDGLIRISVGEPETATDAEENSNVLRKLL